jgi:RNA polymerase subunit RPABC4/transcription elongation factor Spt4
MKDLKDISKRMKEKIEASGIKEKIQDVTEKVKVSSVVGDIQKGISKISLRDKSILAFSRTCSRKYIELGETVTVTIKLQSRYETGVLDCIVTDEIPPQFELIGDMPSMVYQLNTREEKEYQYRIRALMGGHFSTSAICEIENKFSLDDLPSNDMELYVSPLSIQMNEEEMMQEQWKEAGFIFTNISKENMTNLTVSLKQDSKFALDKAQTYDKLLLPNQRVVIPLVLKTGESGSVSLDLDVACIDENGKKYTTEKNFLVSVIEADKTVTKVDIGAIGKVVGSGATVIEDSVVQKKVDIGAIGKVVGSGATVIEDSVVQRSTIGGAESGEEGEPLEKSDRIVQRSDIQGAIDVPEAGRRCPNCNNELQEGWKICPFCGNKLELKCHRCHQRVEEGWAVCPFCGTTLK